MTPRTLKSCLLLSLGLTLSACSSVTVPPPGGFQPPSARYKEQWRPQLHYTPARNWMNDPNGMVYHDGEYHLFYQYNPFGIKWGHMSWGHAVSRDLVHWEELPVAIPEAEDIAIFSGSVVVDKNNTSGFGTTTSPPLVALFTGARHSDGNQSQYLAYSLDRGRTWTRYGTAPVLDIGSKESRDPKVFWHAPTSKWIMVFARATDHKVAFYGSTNLKNWTYLSDFGPLGAGTGPGDLWEVPDLIQLPVDGNTANQKWVMLLSINGGTLWGGSGMQYYTGSFNGTTFTPDPLPAVNEPTGTLYADFEGSTYGSWTVTGTAFGSGPARGTLANQQTVTGYRGTGLVNSYLGGDVSTGTLTSPDFVITKPYISFLIGGGDHPGETALNLIVDGKVVRSATGRNEEQLRWSAFDVTALQGKTARLQVKDSHTGQWGHINVDQILQSDNAFTEQDNRVLWADFGRDFYAASTFDNHPTGDKVWIGWMSNWQYANNVPTYPWRSAMSLVRKLSLKSTPEGVRLAQEPVAALGTKRAATVRFSNLPLSQVRQGLINAGVRGKTLDVVLEVDTSGTGSVGLKFHQGGPEETVLQYNPITQKLSLDRIRSGDSSFDAGLSEVHVATLRNTGTLKLRVVLDTSSIEVFAQDGKLVFTDILLSSPGSDGMEIYSSSGDPLVKTFEVHELKSIWNP
ncbi:glycoside hydrolase family 32 protein [Deinococcus cellulosilyticus]|uniref:Levanase n=1 Tax=Deinococcus cellulosilyticus (strain DSM 18568 / NBRC 106333 / KACC 11606 / 5516J-15) TaxID=1223518 RepID=A0A511N8D0_DEIC1|nr:glycoside hydrolase family 32 protein [Deinococcus cellulosilyticus]GEM49093.1 hypothetical protein DC3_47280 [Deinococcus cellulosilyticus NBRC 106333 = KACC 11606]